MKKNSFLVKLSSFFMAACIMLGCVSAIPVYAMETEESVSEEGMTLIATGKPEDGVINVDTMALAADNNEVPYAVAKPMGTFTCTGDNMTPMKHLVSDNRIHRIVVKVQFRKSRDDRGQGDIRLDMYLRRANTTVNIPMGLQSGEGSNISSSTMMPSTMQTNWLSASPGENFQLFFDVCSKNASDVTGVERIAEIEQYWIYCD